jgi:hypothetical protein
MRGYVLSAGGFGAVIPDGQKGGERTTLTCEGKAWLRCSERDLGDLARATSHADASFVIYAERSSGAGVREAAERVRETPAEVSAGRFSVAFGKVWKDRETHEARYDAELRVEGRTCLACSDREMRELSGLTMCTHDLVSNYLRQGRSVKEWCREHGFEDERQRSRETGRER